MSAEQVPLELLLERVRMGESASLGQLLELYRNYLRLLARSHMGPGMRGRLDPSDLVQEAMLEASRDLARFAGGSERELLVWLRQILVRNLMDEARHAHAQVRDVQRQTSLEAMLDASSSALGDALAGSCSSPSSQAAKREQAVLVADAVEHLPEDFREVIVLRNMQNLPFEEVAQRMGRSSGAVRMLWARALEKLGAEMGVQ